MKNIVIAIMLLFTIQARAATNGLPVQQTSCVFIKHGEVPLHPASLDELKGQLHKYKAYKAGGIAMLVVGAVGLVAGEAMLFTSVAHAASNQTQYYNSQQDPLWRAGLATSLVGVATIGGGIPLVVIGSKKMRKTRREIRKIESENANTGK